MDFKSEIFVESKSGKDSSLSAMERFFWMMYDHFKSQDEAYIKARHKGKLSGCATAISNTSINSMEVWNHPDTTSMQVSPKAQPTQALSHYGP